MLLNKWIRFAMSAAIGVLGLATSFDWTSILSPAMAGTIIAAIGAIKMFLDALAPAAGEKVATTGGGVITHTAA